jgi:hypothetical protein
MPEEGNEKRIPDVSFVVLKRVIRRIILFLTSTNPLSS